MTISDETYRALIIEEYEWLRVRLSLRAVPLLFEDDDKNWPRYGVLTAATAVGRAVRPLARRIFFRRGVLGRIGRVLLPRCIIIPVSVGDLEAMHEVDLVHAQEPPSWRRKTQPPSRDAYIYWDEWRTTLWHEVCHQAQDERDFGWNPHDGYEAHGPSWDEAVNWMAAVVGAPANDLKALIASRHPAFG